jgi:hypothetical protein
MDAFRRSYRRDRYSPDGCWPALFRTRQTCSLAGFGEGAQIAPNLVEWRYGDYEGRTTNEIHAQAPGWSLRQYLRIDRSAFFAYLFDWAFAAACSINSATSRG